MQSGYTRFAKASDTNSATMDSGTGTKGETFDPNNQPKAMHNLGN